MQYKNKIFHVENISTEKLAKKFNTPLYCYSYLKLKNNIINFKNHFSNISPLICFSVKSNSNVKIIKEIKNLDCGADVVSKGEMMKALKAGVNPKKIVFSGVGKTYSELEYAINKNILLINVESKNMIFHIINNTDTMKTNNLGILEPTDGEICTNIDVIIVPGLAFDQFGNRLGFGSGYYDKFLNSQSVGYKIALAFDFQVVDKIDIIEHDVSMDLIITENRTIKVR